MNPPLIRLTKNCLLLINIYHFNEFVCSRLAEERKEEGNQLYKAKQYRDALSKYSEAIGEFWSSEGLTLAHSVA